MNDTSPHAGGSAAVSFPIVMVSEQKEHSDLFVCREAMAIAHGCRNISSAGQRKSVNPPASATSLRLTVSGDAMYTKRN